MKSGTRFLGIDDASHDKFSDEKVSLVGVAYRGTEFIEDIRKTEIEIDGSDSTEKIVEIFKSAEASKIGCILLDGISFGGLNIANIEKIYEETQAPVIAVNNSKPNIESFRNALESANSEQEFFNSLEEPKKVELEEGNIYIQFKGLSKEKAKETVRMSIINGLTPEAIRVAHMIGKIL